MLVRDGYYVHYTGEVTFTVEADDENGELIGCGTLVAWDAVVGSDEEDGEDRKDGENDSVGIFVDSFDKIFDGVAGSFSLVW